MDTNTSEDLFFGELLKQFRTRKRLNQKQLAERIGVSRETVSLWERGEYKPEAEGILYQIADVLALSTQEQQQFFEAYTVTALATSFHNPPSKRNPYFTGRSPQLTHLHTLLMAGKQIALTQAISGLGGIGKTQLALEYAYRHQKSYHDIFWASADTEESLIASYMRFADLLHLPEYNDPVQKRVTEAVHHWFKTHTGWLLIFDNIEDLNLPLQFVPVDRQGSVLLTTRQQVTEPVAQAMELELLPENDAILFLLKRTKTLTIDRSLEDASNDDIGTAKAIVHLLGHLPLALDQAGAYILETRCSFAEYLALFQTHQEQLLQRRISESIPTDHPDSVTTTFRLNFQQVRQQSSLAAEVLCFCAFLIPEEIPEEILTVNETSFDPGPVPIVTDVFQLNQAIEVLKKYSLIRRNTKGKKLSMHRLVQAVLQNQQNEMDRQKLVKRVIQATNAAFPKVEFETWSRCERLLPLALSAVQRIKHEQLFTEETGRLLFETASYLQDRGRYTEAEPLYQQTLHIWQQNLGLEHLKVALALNKLANLHQVQGKYEEAEPLFQRSLHIREQYLGPEHLEVTDPLCGLAELYHVQGKYAEAAQLFQRSLHIREQYLESERPQLAHPIQGLAEIYLKQGKYIEAEPLFHQALRIREQHLGPEHPQLAYPLHGLAILYKEQGKYKEAEPLFHRALRIWEQHLGPEHPNVAHPLNNLATLYREQGKHAEVEPLFQRVLRIREQQLGAEHLDVSYPLNGLAILYREQGKYEEAEPLFQRALRIREQQLGPEHPNVAQILNNMALLYKEQNKHTEAESFFQRALRIWEQQLGSGHPLVAHPLNNMATLYREQGKYEEAEPLYQRALYIREQQLGPEHFDVSYPLNGLAILYREQGRYAKAEPLFQRVIHIREQKLGPEHPTIASLLNGLANLCREQGKYTEAEPLYQRALHIRIQHLGPQHCETAETLHDLSLFFEAQGNSEGAKIWYTRTLDIRAMVLGVYHPKTIETRIRLIALLHTMGHHEEATQLETI